MTGNCGRLHKLPDGTAATVSNQDTVAAVLGREHMTSTGMNTLWTFQKPNRTEMEKICDVTYFRQGRSIPAVHLAEGVSGSYRCVVTRNFRTGMSGKDRPAPGWRMEVGCMPVSIRCHSD